MADATRSLSWATQVSQRPPAQLGPDLVVLFERIAAMPDKVQWVSRQICAELGAGLDPALTRACAAMAETIDGDAATFDRHPYHNRQHFCEVALTAYVLCLLRQVNVQATQFVVLAALIHDVVHEGGAHGPFAQERASIARVRPMLEAAGLDAAQIARLAALVLATESSLGTAFMAAACQSHDGRGPALPVPAAGAELAVLRHDAGLAELARVLCEADILPSIGLSIPHALRLQQRLACEWGRALDVSDKLAFIDGVLAADFLGEFFLPNVHAMRRALVEGAHAALAE